MSRRDDPVPEVPKGKQEFKIIERDGHQVKVFADGTEYDLALQRLVRGPYDNPITRDPKGMLERRREISRQIAREAIDEGAGIDRSKWGTGEGWRAVIRHTTEQYMKSTNIRGMGEVFSKLGNAAGYLTTDPEAGEGPNGSAVNELIHLLAELALSSSTEPREIIEGRTIDDETA